MSFRALSALKVYRLIPHPEYVIMKDVMVMDPKEHERLVRQIGEAFKALPDDWHRIDVLASLCQIMEPRIQKSQDGLSYQWLVQATGSLKGIRMMWKKE